MPALGLSYESLLAVLKRQPELEVTILKGLDVRAGALSNFDVFMVPGGSGKREASSLKESGGEQIKRFVYNGGCYVGTCAGCYLASNAADYLGLLPLGIRDRRHWFRGKTILPIEFTQAGADVFGVSPGITGILYHNGPILDYRQAASDPRLQENAVALSFFRGEIVGRGGTRGAMLGAPAMVLSRYGKGLVLGISPHPEQTPSLNRIIPHALHWLTDHVDKPGPAAALIGFSVQQSTSVSRTVLSATTGSNPQRQGAIAGSAKATGRSSSSTLSPKIWQEANWIWQNAERAHYAHVRGPAGEQVRQTSAGRVSAIDDCSGFVSFVLAEVAPRHYRKVARTEPGWPYPQAKAYVRFFQSLADQPVRGWISIPKAADLQPGDLIAWKKAPNAQQHHGKGNSGHVMIVSAAPRIIGHNSDESLLEVEVIDSSSVRHFPAETLPPHAGQSVRDGLGKGKVRLVLDDNGIAIGYWEGTYWGEGHREIAGPSYTKEIAFARLASLQ